METKRKNIKESLKSREIGGIGTLAGYASPSCQSDQLCFLPTLRKEFKPTGETFSYQKIERENYREEASKPLERLLPVSFYSSSATKNMEQDCTRVPHSNDRRIVSYAMSDFFPSLLVEAFWYVRVAQTFSLAQVLSKHSATSQIHTKG